MSDTPSTLRRTAGVICMLLSLLCLWTAGFAQEAEVAEAVTGTNGMVATAHPLASEAALSMLKAGGNAVDAAVAAAFAIGVVEPDGSGIGGGGSMVVYLNGKQEAHYIDYYQRTSEDVDKISFDPETDRHTAKAVLIPGTVAGLTLALDEFGTLSLEQVLEPAIRYAEEGFAIDATLGQILLDNVEMLLGDSSTAAIFLEDDFPRMEGDMLYQPELATTLRTIAANGRDGFYKGPVAEAMIAEMTSRGGVMTADDLSGYEAELGVPLRGSYRGYEILAAGVPQSGEAILQALNMLENEDLAAMGHFSESPLTLHLMAETFRRVYADRWAFMGDPDFNYVPAGGLISKAFARERFADINRFQADPPEYRQTQAGNPAKYDRGEMSAIEALDPGKQSKEFHWSDEEDDNKSSYDTWGENLFDTWGGKKAKKEDRPPKDSGGKKSEEDSVIVDDDPSWEEEYGGHTTHLSVIDKDGNMVSLTQTLGTFFGSGITSAGVLLNCGMSNFSLSAAPNLLQPGKRPRSSISPTIVLRDGKPSMVIGSPGAGRIIATVVELIVNVVDFDMSATEANWAPRFYCQKFEDYLHLEYGISDEVRQKLERMGHTVRVYENRDLFFGGAQLILVDPVSGEYQGSADPRRGGVAIGY